MSTPLTHTVTPEANAAEQSRMELQAKLNGLGGLGGRKLDPEAKAKKLREACEGFESIFIQKMWQEMRNTVPKSGLFSGREEKFWQDMYDQELSKSMTKAGGIGLADMMYEQLSRGLASASSQAAGNTASQAFVPTAAPLINPVAQLDLPENTQQVDAAAIYDGAAPVTAPGVENAEPAEPVVSPLVPHVAKPQNLTHSESKSRQPGSGMSTLGGQNGIQQAYLAQRDAGDKLSSTGVRPAMRASKKRTETKPAPEQAVNQVLAPGSAQSLAQALELAKTGASIQSTAQPTSLDTIVNEAKARNALRDSLNAKAAQTVAAMNMTETETRTSGDQPVVRKTRFTTNIPRTASSKKGSEAIRLLNVDNVGVNSKQGQGLAEWHKQQAAMAQAAQTAYPGGQSLTAPEPAQPIRPLQANQNTNPNNEGSITIPPLKATGFSG